MPEKNEKDSFTFSEKLKSSSVGGTLSKRIPSKLKGSGKIRKTLIERVKRDAPYYITALLLLLILPLLGKFDGFVTDDGIFVPSEEMVDASALRTAYGSLGIVEGELVGEGEAITEFTGRNPLDLIAGREAKKADRKKVTKVTYDLIEAPKAREKRDAWKGGAIKKAIQRPTTSIGKMAKTFSIGGGKGGSSTSGVVPTGPRGRAYSGVHLRSSTKPLAHYPLQVKGKRGGEKLYSEAARSLGAMPKSGASTALREAQLDSAGGVGAVGGIGGVGESKSAGSSGGAYRPNKFQYGVLEPYWWTLKKMRDKKWMDIEFKLYGKGIDVGSMMACCLLFGDGSCKKFVGNKGASGAKGATCCGYDEAGWKKEFDESFPDTKGKCERIDKPGSKDKKCAWDGGSGASSSKNWWQVRRGCLNINRDKGKPKEKDGCANINDDLSFTAIFSKKHERGRAERVGDDDPIKSDAINDKERWQKFHIVLANLDGTLEENLDRIDIRDIKNKLDLDNVTAEVKQKRDEIDKKMEEFNKLETVSSGAIAKVKAEIMETNRYISIAKNRLGNSALDASKVANIENQLNNFEEKKKKLGTELKMFESKNDAYKKMKIELYKDFQELLKMQNIDPKSLSELHDIEKSANDNDYVVYVGMGPTLNYKNFACWLGIEDDCTSKNKLDPKYGVTKAKLTKIIAWASSEADALAKIKANLINNPGMLPMKYSDFKKEYKPKRKLSPKVKCDIKLTGAKITPIKCPPDVPQQKGTTFEFSAKIENPDKFVYAVLTEDLSLIPNQDETYPIVDVNDFKAGYGTVDKEKGIYTTRPMQIGLSSDTVEGSGQMFWISSPVEIIDELKLDKDIDRTFKTKISSTHTRKSTCKYKVGPCKEPPCGGDKSDEGSLYKYLYDNRIILDVKKNPEKDNYVDIEEGTGVPSKTISFCKEKDDSYRVISSDDINSHTVSTPEGDCFFCEEIVKEDNLDLPEISPCSPDGASTYMYMYNPSRLFDIYEEDGSAVLYGTSVIESDKLAYFCKSEEDKYRVITHPVDKNNGLAVGGAVMQFDDFFAMLAVKEEEIQSCFSKADRNNPATTVYFAHDYPKSLTKINQFENLTDIDGVNRFDFEKQRYFTTEDEKYKAYERENNYDILDDIVDKYKNKDIKLIALVATTSGSGTDVINKALSKRRIDAVRYYLEHNGVNSIDIVDPFSMGEKYSLEGDPNNPADRKTMILTHFEGIQQVQN